MLQKSQILKFRSYTLSSPPPPPTSLMVSENLK